MLGNLFITLKVLRKVQKQKPNLYLALFLLRVFFHIISKYYKISWIEMSHLIMNTEIITRLSPFKVLYASVGLGYKHIEHHWPTQWKALLHVYWWMEAKGNIWELRLDFDDLLSLDLTTQAQEIHWMISTLKDSPMIKLTIYH